MSQPHLEIPIDSIAHGGEALGRDADGRVLFVDGALPGERARVEVLEEQASYMRGRLLALPDPPSPERLSGAPPCHHFGLWPDRGLRPAEHCGGCRWQHVDYAAQLRFKREAVADAFQRIGGIEAPPVAEVIGMQDPWRYRNHLRLRMGPSGAGLVALDHASVLAIEGCPIAHPLVESLLGELELELPEGSEIMLRAGTATGDRMIVIRADLAELESVEVAIDASVVLIGPDGRVQVAAGRPYFVERLGGHDFLVPAGAFFQVNTAMAEILVQEVARVLPARGRMLAEVYAGVGTFTTLLADRFEEVAAIESNFASIAAAADNAAGLDHVSLVEADAAEGLEYLGDAPDVVLVDPPRAGLAPEMRRLLAQHPAHTIAYVSCEPATLARDARELLAGGWSLESCQPVDMFPQTHHIESVSLFRRRTEA